MAKKSSSNAIKKLDEQIKTLTPEIEKEALPILNKKEIDSKAKEVVEKTPTKKKTLKKSTTKKTTAKKTTSTKTKSSTKKTTTKSKASKTGAKKSTTRKKTTTKPAVEKKEELKAREITAEEVKKVVEKNKDSKYNKKELSEATLKMKKFEKHFRNLYDRVNDVVEDIDYVKTVNTTEDVVISDIEKRKDDKLAKIDNINSGLLHKLTIILLGIFIVFSIIVFAIIIYICTY